MSKVDWSLAPEGATHYGEVSSNRICWYSVKSDCRYDYAYQNEGYHAEKWTPSGGAPGHQPLIARPQPKPWSGPEDGLPPVNTVCEVVEGTAYWDSHESEWLGSNVKVKAAFVNDLGQSIVAVERFDGRCSCFIIECLAVTKTPEQIASDKRESAIRELMDIAQVDCRVTAARLVDAGFKREGV